MDSALSLKASEKWKRGGIYENHLACFSIKIVILDFQAEIFLPLKFLLVPFFCLDFCSKGHLACGFTSERKVSNIYGDSQGVVLYMKNGISRNKKSNFIICFLSVLKTSQQALATAPSLGSKSSVIAGQSRLQIIPYVRQGQIIVEKWFLPFHL